MNRYTGGLISDNLRDVNVAIASNIHTRILQEPLCSAGYDIIAAAIDMESFGLC